jgi:hypothetical protein
MAKAVGKNPLDQGLESSPRNQWAKSESLRFAFGLGGFARIAADWFIRLHPLNPFLPFNPKTTLIFSRQLIPGLLAPHPSSNSQKQTIESPKSVV